MKLDKPENPNYVATVVKLKHITPLEGCDNVVGTPLFGFQAIVNKASQVGDIGIVFPAEVQLSEEFCYENNLFRHGDRNKDESVKGYIEDNRRVRAIKFRGHRSDCLFMPLDSLKYTGVNIDEFEEGDEFDTLQGKQICQKYVLPVKASYNRLEKNKDKFRRVDTKYLPEHYDSENFFRNAHVIPPEREIIVTQKLHGTSIRIANTIVRRKLNIFEKIASKLGIKVAETEFDYVYGSRKVIKDINNPYQNHFYGTDIWTEEGKKLDGTLPENFIIYGELIGWTPEGAALQKNYTYGIPEKTCELYVYRVAFVNQQGKVVDLSWDHLVEFCTDLGLKYVPELWRGKMKDFKIEEYMDKRFYDEGYKHCVPLPDKKLVDEGVCVRVDSIAPYILKAKSPIFLQHETALLDAGVVDLETEESVTNEA